MQRVPCAPASVQRFLTRVCSLNSLLSASSQRAAFSRTSPSFCGSSPAGLLPASPQRVVRRPCLARSLATGAGAEGPAQVSGETHAHTHTHSHTHTYTHTQSHTHTHNASSVFGAGCSGLLLGNRLMPAGPPYPSLPALPYRPLPYLPCHIAPCPTLLCLPRHIAPPPTLFPPAAALRPPRPGQCVVR